MKSITDPRGNRRWYEYDSLNRVAAMTDWKGRRTEYTYNERNALVKVKNSFGEERTYEYNPSGDLLQLTDYDGGILQMDYDEINRLKWYKDRDGNETRYAYDQMGNKIGEQKANGGKIQWEYDEHGRMISRRDEEGNEMRYAYDASDHLVRVEDGEGGVSQYVYDPLYRLIKEIDPEGRTTLYEYHRGGNIKSITDQRGNKRIIDYDKCGRRIKETDALGNVTSYSYNQLGKMTRAEDGAGRVTLWEYEKGGLLKEKVYPDKRRERYEYDENGNIIKWQRGDYCLTYDYDEEDRLISWRSNEREEETYTYDRRGNITGITDVKGNRTTYLYSPGGLLTEVREPLGGWTKYQYDSLGNITLMERGAREKDKPRLTQYERDLCGRITAVVNPFGEREEYEYDSLGRVKRKKDREGGITSYTYTLGGEQKSVTYGDGRKAVYRYGSYGQLIEMEDWLGKMKAEYDPYGRIQKVTDHKGRVVAYTHGKMGERTSLTYPDGKTITYRYDSLLRLSSLVEGETEITYQYGENGLLKEKRICGGMESQYGYDSLGRTTKIIHKCHGEDIENCQYKYDQMGNMVKALEDRRGLRKESGEFQYIYDKAGQLICAKKDNHIQREYGYDAFHNRIHMTEGGETTTYIYDQGDRLIEKRGRERIQYAYDPRGNLTAVTKEGRREKHYAYDSGGRLAEAQGAGGERSQYQYNGLGMRTGRIEEREGKRHITEYVLDMTKGWNNLLMVEEGEKRESYIWGNQLEGIEEEGRKSYVFLDSLGSPKICLWYNGREKERYAYDEFGNNTLGEDRRGIGFTGYMRDCVSGTYFAQAREYFPELGRFGGEDIEKGYQDSPITLNGYIYCYNSPLIYIDFTGERGMPEHVKVRIEQGNDAHKTLNLHAKKIPGVEAPKKIPRGLDKDSSPSYHTPSGYGMADIIYHNPLTGEIEVYELKPYTDYGKTRGPVQLKAYIKAINKDRSFWENPAVYGRTLNPFFNTELESVTYAKRKIYYFTDPQYPGMIFWSYKKPERQPQEVTVTEKEENLLKEIALALGAAGLIAIAGILYADDIMGFYGDNMLADQLILQAMEWFSRVGGCVK